MHLHFSSLKEMMTLFLHFVTIDFLTRGKLETTRHCWLFQITSNGYLDHLQKPYNFTKLALRSSYNLIRMKVGQECLIALTSDTQIWIQVDHSYRSFIEVATVLRSKLLIASRIYDHCSIPVLSSPLAHVTLNFGQAKSMEKLGIKFQVTVIWCLT